MDLETLVGQTFSEDELFETIVFEIEENRDLYLNIFCTILLERSPQGLFTVKELVRHAYKKSFIEVSLGLEQKNLDYYKIYFKPQFVIVNFFKKDEASHRTALIMQDYTQRCFSTAVDSNKPAKKMTPEEIRLAFQELANCLALESIKINYHKKSMQ